LVEKPVYEEVDEEEFKKTIEEANSFVVDDGASQI